MVEIRYFLPDEAGTVHCAAAGKTATFLAGCAPMLGIRGPRTSHPSELKYVLSWQEFGFPDDDMILPGLRQNGPQDRKRAFPYMKHQS
jgi:hypothetical protein